MQTPTPPDHAHWLDVLPAIPLTGRAIRVTRAGGDRECWNDYGTLLSTECCPIVIHTDGDKVVLVAGRHSVDGLRLDDWRIDLDDPQGFAHALRHALDKRPSLWRDMTGKADGLLFWRHVHGATTDADRLALARALAEVTP